jgi:phosphatidylinositol alpha-1,6-mannosyltransferase
MVSALCRDTDISIWKHPASLPRTLRIGLAYGRAFFGSMRQPDLVIYDHIHLAALHCTIPWLKKIPYVVFLHGLEVWERLAGRRREALLGARVLLANSATTIAAARVANAWLPKVDVVWLGVPSHPAPGHQTTTTPVALMVGRMASSERLKGHDAVLNAWPEIRAAVPNARLTIIGTGDDQRRLQQRVRKEQIPGVEFCGWLADAERDRLYRSSRLLFLPSKQEGFGIVATEAASFGVPVLGLAGTVIEELFPNGSGILLARTWERQDIALAAIPALADPQLASALGKAAWTRVQQNFLEEHFAERFRRALAALLPVFGEQGKELDSEPLRAGTN